MLKKSFKQKFQHYLNDDALSKSFFFGSNNVLSFHWANDTVASAYICKTIGSDEERVEDLEKELLKLTDVPIWLMSKRGNLNTNLYELYCCYLDPKIKAYWFDLEEILVSLNHSTGPFSSLKSMRWFDKDIYSKFIYLKMIKSWVPRRQFRLNLNIPIQVRAGNSPFFVLRGKIHQISKAGLVVFISSCSQARQWENVSDVNFLKNEIHLQKDRGVENCLQTQEWLHHLENFSLKGDDFQEILNKGVQKQGEKNIFLFIPFDKVDYLSVKSSLSVGMNLRELFYETKDTVHKYINAA